MTRRLHNFKMADGVAMTIHLDSFYELIAGLQTLGEPLDEARQLVTILSSLRAEYEIISSFAKNPQDVTLTEVIEKLLKKYERLEKKESTERAFKLNAGQLKGGQSNGRKGSSLRKNGGGSKGKGFNCG